MMRSVQRIIAIFEAFGPSRSSLTLQEISNEIDLPKSTTFRIIQSLEEAGYIVRLDNLSYCLSFRFVRLAGHVRSTMGIREVARPLMVELSEVLGETVSLHTISEGERVCLDSVTADAPLRSVVLPGEHHPIRVGSASKVLVAHMKEEDQKPLIAAMARELRMSPPEVRDLLAQVREQRYATSHGERLKGISAISAPIFGFDDTVTYCISVGGPSFRIREREAEIVERIRATADRISYHYGGKLEMKVADGEDDDL